MNIKNCLLVLLSFLIIVLVNELFQVLFLANQINMNTDDFQQVKKGMIKRTFLVIFQIFCYLCATLLASLKDYPVLNHHDSNRIIFNDAQAHNNFKNSFLMSIFYLISRLWNTYVNTIKKYKGLVILYLAIPIFLVRKDKHNEYFITFIPLLIYILLHYMYKATRIIKIIIILSIVLCANYYVFFKNKIKVISLPNKVVPFEIKSSLDNMGFNTEYCYVKSKDYNVSVKRVFSNVTIIVWGNIFDILFAEEFTCILYHEIGHVLNNDLLLQNILWIVIELIGFIVLYLINKSYNLTNKVHSKSRLDKLNTLISINIVPILFFRLINFSLFHIFSNYCERCADTYAISKCDPKIFKSALIKIYEISAASFDTSWAYNLLFRTHPTLGRRLNYVDRQQA